MRHPVEHLPGARAAVLGRLWGALARESFAAVTSRSVVGDELVVRLAGGRRLSGPAACAERFADYAGGVVLELDGRLLDDPVVLAAGLGWPQRLREELAGSVENVALARTAVPPSGWSLPEVEARVVDGHPLHPLCRTRTGMSAAEQLAYAPEHQPVVSLDLVAVPAGAWSGSAGWPWRDGGDFLLPVHPWQLRHVLGGEGRRTAGVVEARPLMSLRTLDAGEWHVKTALSVQMTSAVRTVSPASARNGPALWGLVAELSGLEVLAEPFGGGDGRRECSALLRRPPVLAAGEVAVPLSVLAAGPVPMLAGVTAPAAWMAAVAEVLVRPLLGLLRAGVALEAHGQNTFLVLREGWPVRAGYRDFGGVRVSPAILARHGVVCPELAGDIPSDDPRVLRDKLASSLLASACTELVTVLSRCSGVPAGQLWRPVAAELAAVPELLRGPWPLKATTAMRLAADPLEDVWVPVPNPVEAL